MFTSRQIAAIATSLAAALAAPAAKAGEPGRWTPFAAVSIASLHVSDQEFEEFNPGLGLGADYAIAGGWEAGGEAGVFRNSFGERSVYGLGHVTAEILRLGEKTELRAGLFAGLAEYSHLADEAEAAGLPAFGDIIPLGGAMIQLRHAERWEARARIAPLPGDGVAIGFQAVLRIGRNEE